MWTAKLEQYLVSPKIWLMFLIFITRSNTCNANYSNIMELLVE